MLYLGPLLVQSSDTPGPAARYVVYTPGVVAPEIRLHVSHPPPWRRQAERWRRLRLTAELSPRTADLHPIASAMATQFPERRLIQYDCGT